ncbi:MAG TPA: MogA/MoaB family molybdenum cofactor biosynthesis protein [Chloroflexota bacterium]|nr:MogA/MoaB family molybdenum cofactor biosynthesis protein [Chloroflexota bacterium]
MRVAILTVSTRVAAGDMTDRGGPAIEEALPSAWAVTAQKTVTDDLDQIATALAEWADSGQVDLILTTGGTGLGPYDVTPEATERIAHRTVAGIGEALRDEGRKSLPAAMLSRGLGAIRGQTLIVNLPGSPSGAAEGVRVIAPVAEHALHTMQGGHH